MLRPIPQSTAVGHWLTLNWVLTTTWPIAIDMSTDRWPRCWPICENCLWFGTRNWSIWYQRLGDEVTKKISTSDEDCWPYVTPLIPHGHSIDGLLIHCRHTINAIDTQSTLCLTLEWCSDRYVDWQCWPRCWPIHQSTPPIWHMIGDVYVTGQKY